MTDKELDQLFKKKWRPKQIKEKFASKINLQNLVNKLLKEEYREANQRNKEINEELSCY